MQRAFYLLEPGSWRDYANLLHPPYTLWHLSYAVLGGALAPQTDYALLGWTVLAFFLAMGLGAHALDELHGRPLRTRIPSPLLWAVGIAGPALAAAIGWTVGLAATPLILPCIALGVFLVFAYNLEWGPFHHDLVFALAWGAFPALTSFIAQSGGLTAGSILVALAAAATSHVQRILSTRVRYVRRRVVKASGYLEEPGARRVLISRDWLVRPDEQALLLLSASLPLLALGVLLRGA